QIALAGGRRGLPQEVQNAAHVARFPRRGDQIHVGGAKRGLQVISVVGTAACCECRGRRPAQSRSRQAPVSELPPAEVGFAFLAPVKRIRIGIGLISQNRGGRETVKLISTSGMAGRRPESSGGCRRSLPSIADRNRWGASAFSRRRW